MDPNHNGRRTWIALYKYERKWGRLDYKPRDLREQANTCKWCHGPLKNNRQKSFCSEDCKYWWYQQYVFGRNRPPVPWRILCRDDFTCQKCGWKSRFINKYGVTHFSSRGLDVHHIQYVSHGGTDHESNLITLCRDCHRKEHSRESNEIE